KNEIVAKDMIAFLKKNKFGRATFLPLTTIIKPQEFKAKEILAEEGVLGLADSLVKFDEEYKNVAKAMLGRIVVVETIDCAIKLAKKYDYSVRMVTLEGELLIPGGAISGGTFKNNSNLLSRRREIVELEEKSKNDLLKMDELLESMEALKKERNSLRMKIEECKSNVQKEYIKQNTARLNIETAKTKRQETASGFQILKEETLQLDQQVIDINKEKIEIEEKLNQSLSMEQITEEVIKKYQEELEVMRKKEMEQSAFVSEKEVEVEKVKQGLEFELINLQRVESEILKYTTEAEEIKYAIQQGNEEVAQKEKNIEEILKTMEAYEKNQSKEEEELSKDWKQKEELSLKQKNFFKIREELSERINALDKELYRLAAQREKFTDIIQAQIDYMWNEYEITLRDAATLRMEELDNLTVIKRDIAQLKDSIKRLGDVNVNAIEDYKNLSERYGFLKTQHDDLVEAEKTLVNIIEELDVAMRKQFKEKFSEIQKEFDHVFKDLFGGGKGTIEIMEDEDLLEAGIKIIAQPPGKKLQNMMQLSGGEKALTAIALLFAIQNLKPSPFCLLDEIEAALDESNVGRFAKYLHKLTKYTQFIVITHRRGTMERADRLYGITMQEKGISTLVSVNLVEEELEN
ncbi:MAG: chromosome segregation protein SMC, partial [Lachnospiraceae bacterium]